MKTKFLIVLASIIALVAFAGDIVIYPNGVVAGEGGSTSCPGKAIGYAVYAIQRTNGWGWKPDTNGNTSFSATYTNQAGCWVQILGHNGDLYCNVSNTGIPNPPYSPTYRFTVWWPHGAHLPTSTNDAPLQLHNFIAVP